MKLASFRIGGRSAYGIVSGGGVIDAARRLASEFPTLRTVLAADALDRLHALADAAPDYTLDEIAFDIPIPEPSKIICIGRNYRGHLAEAGMKLPDKPSVFIRTLESFVPHAAPIIRPQASTDYDFEGELCLVIGRTARHVTREDALSHIAGYTCMNEACLRDFQFTHSLTVGKNFYRSGSIGPWMTTADAIPDPTQMMLRTHLNGVEVQHTQTDDLIFDIPEIIRYLSVLLPLNPGDIIATGTPEGVGFARTPPLWLKPGDVVEVDISGIGTLRNQVIDEA